MPIVAVPGRALVGAILRLEECSPSLAVLDRCPVAESKMRIGWNYGRVTINYDGSGCASARHYLIADEHCGDVCDRDSLH
jgi:hypothetical protein